jgi:hypothetical protein
VPEQPAADWFVIRGGLFARAEDVLTSVSDALEDGYGATASVFVGRVLDGETLEQAIGRICKAGYIRNGKVRMSTVGSLRAAGFTLELDTSDGQPECHYNVIFSEPPDLGQAKLFIQCFDAPIPNPAKE